MEYKEIERIFYRDGYRLAHQHLGEGIHAAGMAEGIRRVYEAVDELLDAFLKRSAAEGKAAECKNGCDWCCHQTVFAVTHEFLYLQEHLRSHVDEATRQGILERARKKSMLTLHKTLREQLLIRFPCPFLESGSCSVYKARPMACRIYLSSSVKACRREHDHPGDGQPNSGLFEFPLRAGRMLNEGFVAYLKQTGFQVNELTLEQGYSSMVTQGQNMEDWIRRSTSST